MEKNFQAYFTTKEFANLCNVSKHTLFYYDEIGVFSPAVTDENGYRYYAAAQLEVFGVISILKELDMPLKEIKAYLDRRSPEEFLKLLKQETVLLNQKQSRLKQVKQLMNSKQHLIETAISIDVNSIYLEELQNEYLIITKCKPWTGDKVSAVCIAEHIHYCEENNIYSPYSIGAMVLLNEIINENYIGYSYFYTQLVDNWSGDGLFEKKRGLYLTAYHSGGYTDVWKTYQKMIAYAENHKLKLEGYFFEGVLLDDLVVKGYENYVLKLSIRAEKGDVG